MKCKCPNCKKSFDITEIIEPIRKQTIKEIGKEVLKRLYPNDINKMEKLK